MNEESFVGPQRPMVLINERTFSVGPLMLYDYTNRYLCILNKQLTIFGGNVIYYFIDKVRKIRSKHNYNFESYKVKDQTRGYFWERKAQ